METVNSDLVQRSADTIVTAVNPQRIILFGSQGVRVTHSIVIYPDNLHEWHVVSGATDALTVESAKTTVETRRDAQIRGRAGDLGLVWRQLRRGPRFRILAMGSKPVL